MDLSSTLKLSQLSDKHVSERVVVAGKIFRRRGQGSILFIDLYDSVPSMHKPLQLVFVKGFLKGKGKDIAEIAALTADCSLSVYGEYKKVKDGQSSPTGHELIVEDWFIESVIADPSKHYHEYPELPLPPGYFEMARDYEHQPYEGQWITKATIYYVHAKLRRALEDFLLQEEFEFMKTPVITFGDCEGGAAQFLIAPPRSEKVIELLKDPAFDQFKYFFGSVAALSGSAQLELETLGRDAYCITTAFRAEESDTAKHLAEFTMFEFEKHHSRSSADIRSLAERALKHMLKYALEHLREYIEFVHSRLLDIDESFQQQFAEGVSDIPASARAAKYADTKRDAVAAHIAQLYRFSEEPFAVIKHADAVELMLSQPEGTFKELPAYDKDISSEHEKFITRYTGRPTHVIYFPQKEKSFYMPLIKETEEESHGVPHVDCFDTLWPGTGEIVGGSQRISSRGDLTKVAEARSMAMPPLEPYLISRDHGMAHHGGCGIGFDRVLKCFMGGQASFSVRDATPYTRFRRCGKAFDY